jgi:hypothetical protein
MKFLKSTIAIVALLTIVSVSAKQMGQKSVVPGRRESVSTKPMGASKEISSKLYQQMSDHISRISAANDQFTQNFIATIQKANLTKSEKNALLNAAQDMYNTTLPENCHEHAEDLTAALEYKEVKLF